MITSPATRPELAAGVLAMTVPTVTPFVAVGAPVVGPPVKDPESPEFVGATSIPRIAVVPMWTVVDASPFSIVFAIRSAVLIGIAYAWAALVV